MADQPTIKAVLHNLRRVLSSISTLHGTELYVLSDGGDTPQVVEFDREADTRAINIGTKVLRIGAGRQRFFHNSYMESTYSELYPENSEDEGFAIFSVNSLSLEALAATALRKRRALSTGAANCGYSLSHAFGSVSDDPDLISVGMVGDGESETGPGGIWPCLRIFSS